MKIQLLDRTGHINLSDTQELQIAAVSAFLLALIVAFGQ